MTQERFRQIRGIFEAALERAPESRLGYLADACAGDSKLAEEVAQLLSAHKAEDETVELSTMAQRMRVDTPSMEPRQIGPYEVLRELGKGGMGIVYLARKADGESPRLLALKVLRGDHPTEDSLRRFEQERRILAVLNHANIAQIIDGGRTAEGLPYYVMEFVDGLPIDLFCDDRRLDVKGRLSLFQQVCAAVQSAHRKGVIHRDIKPSNILVTAEGVVKLLDFGIAKLLPSRNETTQITKLGSREVMLTDANLRPMTPEYASPEQVRDGEATHASDVYSLGVVLYELLTGHRPYRMKNRLFHEVLRVVCEEEPTLPSLAVNQPPEAARSADQSTSDGIGRLRQTTIGELRKQLSGDLDSVLLKALRKDAWQRYRSAAQFSEDLGRHLQGLPVEARSGRVYRIGKELSRRRGLLAAAVFMLVAFASGGIRVGWSALWTAVGVAAMYVLWQASVDRELGRRIAALAVWRVVPVVGVLAVIATLIGVDFIRGATAFFAGLDESDLTRDLVGRWWRLLWFIAVALLFARWLLRQRWAGRLVLDAPWPRNRFLGAVAVFVLIAAIWSYISHGYMSRMNVLLSSGDVDIVSWGLLFYLSGRREFRANGIVTTFGFYRWTEIESYAWTEAALPIYFTLTLHVHRQLSFLPPVRLKVYKEERPEVEMVMSRYLSEWPAASHDAVPHK